MGSIVVCSTDADAGLIVKKVQFCVVGTEEYARLGWAYEETLIAGPVSLSSTPTSTPRDADLLVGRQAAEVLRARMRPCQLHLVIWSLDLRNHPDVRI